MPQRAFLRVVFAATVLLLALSSAARADTSCEKLAAIPLDGTKIVSSAVLTAGSLLPPGVEAANPDAGGYKDLAAPLPV